MPPTACPTATSANSPTSEVALEEEATRAVFKERRWLCLCLPRANPEGLARCTALLSIAAYSVEWLPSEVAGGESEVWMGAGSRIGEREPP